MNVSENGITSSCTCFITVKTPYTMNKYHLIKEPRSSVCAVIL